MRRPAAGEYHPRFQPYIELTRGADMFQNLQDSGDSLLSILQQVSPGKEDHAYAPGKWTIKQVVQHIIDTDTVFLYRAISIARDPSVGLPGFDHVRWAEQAPASHLTLEKLANDYRLLRHLTLNVFQGMTAEALENEGTVSHHALRPLSIGFIVAGHSFHHIGILKDRYL